MTTDARVYASLKWKKSNLETFLVDCLLYHPEVIRRYFLPEPFAAFFLTTRVVVSSTFTEEVKKKSGGQNFVLVVCLQPQEETSTQGEPISMQHR